MTATERKRCPKCKTVRPAADFYRVASSGLSGWCRECSKQSSLERGERRRARMIHLDQPAVLTAEMSAAEAEAVIHRITASILPSP